MTEEDFDLTIPSTPEEIAEFMAKHHSEYGPDGRPISMEEWGRLRLDFEGNCRVASTHIGGAHVSTVWLGMDMGWNFNNDPAYRPVIFETMIFGDAPSVIERLDDLEQEGWRYCTWEEAADGHEMVCALVRSVLS